MWFTTVSLNIISGLETKFSKTKDNIFQQIVFKVINMAITTTYILSALKMTY